MYHGTCRPMLLEIRMPSTVRFRRHLRNRAAAAAAIVETLEPRTLFSFELASVAQFTGNLSGIQPAGLVMDSAGNLFGTTSRGGANKYGIIFEIPATSNTVITLASFTGANGIYPVGSLVIDSGGVLWGTTSGGGASGKGTVFSFLTGSTASTINTVVSFNGINGSYPQSGLTADSSGNLYGTTLGSTKGANASTVFMIAASSGTFIKVANIKPAEQALGGVVVDLSGNIFGTTSRGGTKNLGTVFSFPAGSTSSFVTTLASFTGSNGTVPTSNLLLDSGGNVVGISGGGGTHSAGTIFRFNVTASTITTLAHFRGSNGSRPLGNLIVDASGNYYGVTALGGSKGRGVVFEFPAGTTSSTVTALFSFTGKSTGQNPTGALVLDNDGRLYGGTYSGGTSNRGVIFEISEGGSSAPALAPAVPTGSTTRVGLLQSATAAAILSNLPQKIDHGASLLPLQCGVGAGRPLTLSNSAVILIAPPIGSLTSGNAAAVSLRNGALEFFGPELLAVQPVS
jgi:uncharacterized repeat protein (TIGR03803 family)